MNTKTGLLALLTSSLALGCLPESKSLGGSGSDDDTTSPGDSSSGSESVDDTAPGDPACTDPEAELTAFVEQNRFCETSNDCQGVEGYCYSGAGAACGIVALSHDADLQAFGALHDELMSCRDECAVPDCGASVVCKDSLCSATVGLSCNLDEQVTDLLYTSADFPDGIVDCGDLRLDDPLDAWIDARACLLDAQQSGTGVRLIHALQGIDSLPSYAYVGLQWRSYQRYQLFHDEGGIVPAATTSRRDCENFSPIDDCEVEPGNLCLGCEGTDDYEIVCTAPD